MYFIVSWIFHSPYKKTSRALRSICGVLHNHILVMYIVTSWSLSSHASTVSNHCALFLDPSNVEHYRRRLKNSFRMCLSSLRDHCRLRTLSPLFPVWDVATSVFLFLLYRRHTMQVCLIVFVSPTHIKLTLFYRRVLSKTFTSPLNCVVSSAPISKLRFEVLWNRLCWTSDGSESYWSFSSVVGDHL